MYISYIPTTQLFYVIYFFHLHSRCIPPTIIDMYGYTGIYVYTVMLLLFMCNVLRNKPQLISD